MDIAKVRGKSVGSKNKTPKKPTENPILTLFALLITKKFLGFDYCPEINIEEYSTKIKFALEEIKTIEGVSDKDKKVIDSLLSGRSQIKTNCKNTYQSIPYFGGFRYKVFSLNATTGVEESFRLLFEKLPKFVLVELFEFEPLTDLLGASITKEINTIWSYAEENGIEVTRRYRTKSKKVTKE